MGLHHFKQRWLRDCDDFFFDLNMVRRKRRQPRSETAQADSDSVWEEDSSEYTDSADNVNAVADHEDNGDIGEQEDSDDSWDIVSDDSRGGAISPEVEQTASYDTDISNDGTENSDSSNAEPEPEEQPQVPENPFNNIA